MTSMLAGDQKSEPSVVGSSVRDYEAISSELHLQVFEAANVHVAELPVELFDAHAGLSLMEQGGGGEGVANGNGNGHSDGEGDMEEYGQMQQQLHSCKMRLHERLQVATVATAERTAQKHGMEISSLVMSALKDLTFKSAERLAIDAELFAQHAGRKSVVVDDVLLVARRNEDVLASLRLVAQGFAKSKEKGPEKKRKKAVADAPDT